MEGWFSISNLVLENLYNFLLSSLVNAENLLLVSSLLGMSHTFPKTKSLLEKRPLQNSFNLKGGIRWTILKSSPVLWADIVFVGRKWEGGPDIYNRFEN